MVTWWEIGKIPVQIEAVKREIELDTQLSADDIAHLEKVAEDLRYLHDQAIIICLERNLPIEKCHIAWWIDY